MNQWSMVKRTQDIEKLKKFESLPLISNGTQPRNLRTKEFVCSSLLGSMSKLDKDDDSPKKRMKEFNFLEEFEDKKYSFRK